MEELTREELLDKYDELKEDKFLYCRECGKPIENSGFKGELYYGTPILFCSQECMYAYYEVEEFKMIE